MAKNKLKAALLDKFGFQYLAARKLGIRDDDLSAFIKGRRELPEETLERLRSLLSIDQNAFDSLIHGGTAEGGIYEEQ